MGSARNGEYDAAAGGANTVDASIQPGDVNLAPWRGKMGLAAHAAHSSGVVKMGASRCSLASASLDATSHAASRLQRRVRRPLRAAARYLLTGGPCCRALPSLQRRTREGSTRVIRRQQTQSVTQRTSRRLLAAPTDQPSQSALGLRVQGSGPRAALAGPLGEAGAATVRSTHSRLAFSPGVTRDGAALAGGEVDCAASQKRTVPQA